MKTKTTHTPGPWKPDGGIYVRCGDWPVATINGTLVQSEANARLIAASPDILAALKEEHADRVFRVNAGPDVEAMMEMHKREEPGCPSCDAIFKAEGR